MEISVLLPRQPRWLDFWGWFEAVQTHAALGIVPPAARCCLEAAAVAERLRSPLDAFDTAPVSGGTSSENVQI